LTPPLNFAHIGVLAKYHLISIWHEHCKEASPHTLGRAKQCP